MQRFQINEIARARWTAFAFLLLSAITTIAAPYIHIPIFSFYLTVHVTALHLCLILYALVFAVTWNACDKNLKRSSVVLAITFASAASLDFLYLYLTVLPGMPPLIPHNNGDEAPYFWMMARLVIALGVFTVAYIPSNATTTRLWSAVMLTFAFTGIAAFAYAVFRGWDALPILTANGETVNTFKSSLDYLTLGVHLITSVLLYQGLLNKTDKKTAEPVGLDRSALLAATLAMTTSQICTIYLSNFASITSLLEPVYQLMAAIFFYRYAVSNSITAPYMTLSNLNAHLQATTAALNHRQARLIGIIENATDAIITADESQTIILANPSAAVMFGTTVEEMRGSPIEKYIPIRHRKGYQGYVKHFGKIRFSFFKMGKRSHTDYDVTGLRTNGEEFPIEASISSMMENSHRFHTLILRDITERKQAQEELAKSHEELTRLSNALQSVREEERRNIARDLHDDLGQLLAALRIDLTLLQQQAMQAVVLPKQLVSMDELLTISITSLRRIATDLRPRALDEAGLYFALQTLCKEFVVRHGISCELLADEHDLALDDQRSTAMFRIIQESLSNVFRHAAARKVTIKFKRNNGELEITIEDDGRGIRSEDMGKNRSFGLVDMRERVRAMHGDMTISSETYQGTLINIAIPL